LVQAAQAGDDVSVQQLERIRECAEAGDPAAAKALAETAQQEVAARWKLYEHWAAMPGTSATQEKGQ